MSLHADQAVTSCHVPAVAFEEKPETASRLYAMLCLRLCGVALMFAVLVLAIHGGDAVNTAQMRQLQESVKEMFHHTFQGAQ